MQLEYFVPVVIFSFNGRCAKSRLAAERSFVDSGILDKA